VGSKLGEDVVMALNFIPLVIWAVAFAALGVWDEHLRQVDGRGAVPQVVNRAFAEVYLGGVFVFLVIGVVLSV